MCHLGVGRKVLLVAVNRPDLELANPVRVGVAGCLRLGKAEDLPFLCCDLVGYGDVDGLGTALRRAQLRQDSVSEIVEDEPAEQILEEVGGEVLQGVFDVAMLIDRHLCVVVKRLCAFVLNETAGSPAPGRHE